MDAGEDSLIAGPKDCRSQVSVICQRIFADCAVSQWRWAIGQLALMVLFFGLTFF